MTRWSGRLRRKRVDQAAPGTHQEKQGGCCSCLVWLRAREETRTKCAGAADGTGQGTAKERFSLFFSLFLGPLFGDSSVFFPPCAALLCPARPRARALLSPPAARPSLHARTFVPTTRALFLPPARFLQTASQHKRHSFNSSSINNQSRALQRGKWSRRRLRSRPTRT